MKWQFGRVSDDEALRLMTAFLQIGEPELRREVVELAESYERASVRQSTFPPKVKQDNDRSD